MVRGVSRGGGSRRGKRISSWGGRQSDLGSRGKMGCVHLSQRVDGFRGREVRGGMCSKGEGSIEMWESRVSCGNAINKRNRCMHRQEIQMKGSVTTGTPITR